MKIKNKPVSKTVLKGYMMKKGHKRKNWTERWFVLRPNSLSYYVSEDLLEKKGDIILDQIYCVEVKSVPPFVVWSSNSPGLEVECGLDRPGVGGEMAQTQTWTFPFRFSLFQPGLGLEFICVFFLSFSLWQIKKEGNACSWSSAVIKALRSVPQIRRKSRNGFKVFFSAL